jgi:tRNA modification GTPase
VELAKERLSCAQLVLAVFDASAPLDGDDCEILEEIKDKNAIIILNKWDKPRVLAPENFKDFSTVCICAKQGDGLEELKAQVEHIAGVKNLDYGAAVLISERQRECALKAKNAVQSAHDAFTSGLTTDAVGICIDDAIAALLELTGERVTNEVTDEIFRSFCVGK